MDISHRPLDLNILKKELNVSDQTVEASKFSETDLQTIYSDYISRYNELERLKAEFVNQYIASAKGIGIHSYNGRTKDPYHLIEKIIRKRSTKFEKYKNMTTCDYYKYITDLIGCRILTVYKKDWRMIHDYLTEHFSDNPVLYINENQYAESYDKTDTSTPPFMAEAPIAHIRLGDPEIYKDTLKIENDRYYRSVHYVIRYGEYYIEIQVRTLFDEAWGEVDHNVLYPYFKDDPILVGFSKLINRASGMCDEMSAYFKDQLSETRLKHEGPPLDVPIDTTRAVETSPVCSSNTPENAEHGDAAIPSINATAQEALDDIIFLETRRNDE